MLSPEDVQAARAQLGVTPAPSSAGGAAGTPSLADTIRAAASGKPAAGSPGAPAAPAAPTDDTEASQAWFKATGNENPLQITGKVVGNMAPSAFQFGKGVLSFLNPLNTVDKAAQIGKTAGDALNEGQDPHQLFADTVKGLPAAAYQLVVPQFLKHIFAGDLDKAAATLENDPVGQIAPLILSARGAASALGKGEEFDAAMSKLASPITEKLPATGTKVVEAIKSVIPEAVKTPKPADKTDVAGKIVQGDTAESKVAAQVLPQIDTTGVKTYADLSEALQKQIKANLQQVDEAFGKKTETVKLADLEQTHGAGEGVEGVKINYVKEALSGLQELYSKTKDPKNQARIEALTSKAEKDGLTPAEINQVAREYGTEFGSKAFSKRSGDPLTSVNAQAYENIRSGVKETARGFLEGDEAGALDKNTSSMIKVKGLVDTMKEKVNALEQRVVKRGVFEKVGRALGQVVDVATMGSLKSFVQKLFFPSNVGLKTMNSIDMEEQLSKNLEMLKKLEDGGDEALGSGLVDIWKQLKSGADKVNKLPSSMSVPLVGADAVKK